MVFNQALSLAYKLTKTARPQEMNQCLVLEDPVLETPTLLHLSPPRSTFFNHNRAARFMQHRGLDVQTSRGRALNSHSSPIPTPQT